MTIWKKVQVGGEMYQFDELDPLQGTLTAVERNQGQEKNSTIYTLITDSGEVKFWGSTVLNSKLEGIAEGTLVRITYLGKARGKSGREYKDYDVEIAE